MIRKRKRGWFLLGLLLLGIVGLFALPRLLPNHDLLQMAQPILVTRDWKADDAFSSPRYDWITPTDVIFFQDAPGSGLQAMRQSTAPGSQPQPLPIVIPRTRKADTLGKIYENIQVHTLSPDRRWLLTSKKSAHRNRRFTAYSLNGTQVASGEDTWGSEARWLPDSSGYGVTRWKQMPVLDVFRLNQKTPQEYPLPFNLSISHVPRLLGSTPEGRLTGILSSPQPSPNLQTGSIPQTWFDLNLSTQTATLTERVVSTPVSAVRNTLQAAPDGNRWAWFNCTVHKNTVAAWLHDMIPIFPMRSEQVAELWVAGAAFQQQRKLGQFRYYLPYGSDVGTLHWLPDSRHVSFVFRSRLYVVPVE